MDLKAFSKSVLHFLPLLVLYVVLISIFSSDELVGDETRHMKYATNLTHGYYTSADNPELGNGPGYPLIISLFVILDAPYLFIRLINAFFMFAGVLLFYKTLLIYTRPTVAILLSYCLGLYTSSLKWMLLIHSEALAVFLVCGFIYYFIKFNHQKSQKYKYLLSSGFFLGFLVLTKVIFAYVVLFCLLLYLISFFLLKIKKSLNPVVVCGVAFVVCLPYLIYTYSLTGNHFYWGSQGGEMLYWRTSPFPNEYGDWISKDVIFGIEEHNFFSSSAMTNNHRSFLESLEPYSHVERDNLYKEKAIENIKQYPIKYVQNTVASALRLFFNYPYSYTQQKVSTYFYIIPNSILLLFLLSSVYVAIRNPKSIPFEIRFVFLVALIFIGGLILLDGRVRHLIPAIPILLLFIGFVYNGLVTIEIGPKLNQNTQGKD